MKSRNFLKQCSKLENLQNMSLVKRTAIAKKTNLLLRAFEQLNEITSNENPELSFYYNEMYTGFESLLLEIQKNYKYSAEINNNHFAEVKQTKDRFRSTLTIGSMIKKEVPGEESFLKRMTLIRKQNYERKSGCFDQNEIAKIKSEIAIKDFRKIIDDQNSVLEDEDEKKNLTEKKMRKSFVNQEKRRKESVNIISENEPRKSRRSELRRFDKSQELRLNEIKLPDIQLTSERVFRLSISKYIKENSEESKFMTTDFDKNFRSYLVDQEIDLANEVIEELNFDKHPTSSSFVNGLPLKEQKLKLIMLRPLKELIDEFLKEKKIYDNQNAIEYKNTKSSIEAFFYHYLKNKHIIPDLISKNGFLIIDSVKYYAGIDYQVALFEYVS